MDKTYKADVSDAINSARGTGQYQNKREAKSSAF